MIFQDVLNNLNYSTKLIKKVVKLDFKEILIKKRNKNFYIFDIFNFSLTIFAIINVKTKKK